ncbi:MAG: bifunctional folylpolyglutamate synthase/dihydrofolate synthase [Agathobacter sp.]|nr:bifunctional folylpolyglutamate synthase/dihydrofolate synthase [Agathobacter sp.]
MSKYKYEEVREKIENSHRFGNLPGVEVTGRMLNILGQPQDGLPFIHVAGTNGKGSTCAFLNSILTEAGLRVGCFTSPHLFDLEERIMIGNQMISKADVTRLGNQLLSLDYGVIPTMFDYCLVMAVLYFREKKCDVAIMETGLGGRLDSTNALGKPAVAVINRIGYDHMEILGNTLEEIAEEKAGILKSGVQAVFAPQEDDALAVLLQHAKGMLVTKEDMEQVAAMKPGLQGAYQLENGAAAMLAARVLREESKIPMLGEMTEESFEKAIHVGIQRAVWPGRMEILSRQPFLMVDGAHNSNGIHALRTSLEQMYPQERFHFVMGVMADKDYEEMIEELLPLAIDFVTVTPETNRALQGEELAVKIRKRGIPARSVRNIEEVPYLLSEKEKNIALGSLYFIGELRVLWKNGG